MVREFLPAPIRSRRTRGALIATTLVVAATLCGCGVKGPLKLPSSSPAAATGAPATATPVDTADNPRKSP